MEYVDLINHGIIKNLNDIPNDVNKYSKGLCEFSQSLLNVLKLSESVGLYGDYDADGAFSCKIMYEVVKALTDMYCEVKPYHYQSRTHKLDKIFALTAVQERYDCVIITDTGSSLDDFQYILKISASCGAVFIIDHHNVSLDISKLPENVYLLNTTIEKEEIPDYDTLSAGGLSYYVAENMLYIDNYEDTNLLNDLKIYAFISLYADIMNMSSDLNRKLHSDVLKIPTFAYPECIKPFIPKYSSLTARCVQYSIAPKINACFRSEEFWPLIGLLFETTQSYDYLYDQIKCIQDRVRPALDLITDIADIEEYNNFVFCNISNTTNVDGIKASKLYNYTGLLANKIANKYKKICIVVCRAHSEYKGSVRAKGNLDVLSITKKYCNAGGHPPAHGFTLSLNAINAFNASLNSLDNSLRDVAEEFEDIIVEVSSFSNKFIMDVAMYNEFVGVSSSKIILSYKLLNYFKESKTDYGYMYRFYCDDGINNIILFTSNRIIPGSTINVIPYMANSTTANFALQE